MIQGLKFKDSEGYIRTTIDNQIFNLYFIYIKKYYFSEIIILKVYQSFKVLTENFFNYIK